MDQSILISTALISSLWDMHHKDSFDLMLPFIKYVVSKTTQVGDYVDVELIAERFIKEYGYVSVPQNVIIMLLNRLCPQTLKRSQGKYQLSSSLEKEAADFEARSLLYKERRNNVGDALSTYLNQNESNLNKPYSCESALAALISFFSNRGLVVAQTPEQLSLIRNNSSEKSEYCIARFIVEEQKKDSPLFSYVLDMVKGFFVSSAITFQPENTTVSKTKFKKLQCFLDTRIILNALGLRLPAGNKAALELLSMLKSEQAMLCCFSHTLVEIRDIIKAYRRSLLSSGRIERLNTLEHWDELHYSADQVTRYLLTLDNKIEALGITIVQSPAHMQSYVKGLKVTKFKSILKTRVKYHSDIAYKNDVLSAMGVMKLRNGHKSVELEKSNCIFITTNIPLIGSVDSCLFDPGEATPPVISDTTMSAIVWLKCCQIHKDFPKHKLIEQAMLALEPTNSLLSAFYIEIHNLKAEGNITREEALIISSDIQFRRELADATNGDVANVNKELITDMQRRLKERYVGENRQQVEDEHRQFLRQKRANDNALEQLSKTIDDAGIAAKNKSKKIIGSFLAGLWGILLSAFVVFLIIAFAVDNKFFIWSASLLVLNILAAIDLFVGKLHLIKRFVNKLSEYYAEKARSKKQIELQPIIDKLMETSI